MRKITFLLIIALALLFSCSNDEIEDNKKSYREIFEYYTPVFVGKDSILYIEKYHKDRLSWNVLTGEVSSSRQWDWCTEFKLIDTLGQEISTIWSDELKDEVELSFLASHSISYSKEAEILFIGLWLHGGKNLELGVITMNLEGEILSSVTDSAMWYEFGNSSINFYPIYSSPDGMYYAFDNKIKNIKGELIKTTENNILDWNHIGLLVRGNSIDSTIIELNDKSYKQYSHPQAQIWYGKDFKYLYLDWEKDNTIICNWSLDTLNYLHTPLLRDNFEEFSMNTISPDLKYFVFTRGVFGGIYLLNLINGETRVIRNENTAWN